MVGDGLFGFIRGEKISIITIIQYVSCKTEINQL